MVIFLEYHNRTNSPLYNTHIKHEFTVEGTSFGFKDNWNWEVPNDSYTEWVPVLEYEEET